eukprot:2322214-Rhodomonas_salina.1
MHDRLSAATFEPPAGAREVTGDGIRCRVSKMSVQPCCERAPAAAQIQKLCDKINEMNCIAVSNRPEGRAGKSQGFFASAAQS